MLEGESSGIVYRRTDLNGGKPYIGQTKSEERFIARQGEHADAHPEAEFRYEELGRAQPGVQLVRLEEYHIRAGGGPSTMRNPLGGLANQRHQMNAERYLAAGGDY
jgi:hypothetical protein